MIFFITIINIFNLVPYSNQLYAEEQYNEGSNDNTSNNQSLHEWIEPITKMKFVFIQGKSFILGCSDDDSIFSSSKCQYDEYPSKEVTVSSFWVGKFEVTKEQWEKINQNDHSKMDAATAIDYPIVNVSFDDIQKFIKKLNAQKNNQYIFRLPTEAEWELICKYDKKIDIDSVAWYADNSNNELHKVGLKEVNEYGVHDLLGNVWEWCQDTYASGSYKYLNNTDPVGNYESKFHVIRGGGWYSNSSEIRCSNRAFFPPSEGFRDVGFRLVRQAVANEFSNSVSH